MDSKQTALIKLVSNAYKSIKRGEDYIHVLDEDKLNEETAEAIRGIQRELGVSFEISFEIMATACDLFSDIDPEIGGLEGCDFYEMATDSASVYTYPRLQYLDSNNRDDITDILKEYSCDIQTACAVWYDQKVAEACEALRAWIISQ